MRKNDEVFSRFVEFKELVEKESRKKVKALRGDNVCEFVSNAFEDFYSQEGIQIKLIAPYNPQQNGVV